MSDLSNLFSPKKKIKNVEDIDIGDIQIYKNTTNILFL